MYNLQRYKYSIILSLEVEDLLFFVLFLFNCHKRAQSIWYPNFLICSWKKLKTQTQILYFVFVRIFITFLALCKRLYFAQIFAQRFCLLCTQLCIERKYFAMRRLHDSRQRVLESLRRVQSSILRLLTCNFNFICYQ